MFQYVVLEHVEKSGGFLPPQIQDMTAGATFIQEWVNPPVVHDELFFCAMVPVSVYRVVYSAGLVRHKKYYENK